MVLQCPLLQEDVLRDFLSRIIVNLEAYSVGTKSQDATQDAAKASVKDLVSSHTLESSDDPVIAVGEDDDDEEKNSKKRIYVLWKQEIHVCMACSPLASDREMLTAIARTQIRSHNPSLYLSTAARLRPSSYVDDPNDEYITPFQAESVNLFHSLQFDPSFKDKKPPVLSAARLSKHTPAGAAVREQPRPLKNLTRTLHKLLPAVNTRLRCTRIGGGLGKASRPPRILASIEVESAPASSTTTLDATIELETVDVSLSNGKAAPIPGIDLPRTCCQGDLLSFVYDLSPDTDTTPLPPTSRAATQTHVLNLDLTAKINSHQDRRKISTKWRTTLDLSPLYPPSRPAKGTANAHPMLITIHSPPAPIRASEMLTWTVTITNNTSNPGRALRAKIEPLINDSSALVASKPYVITHALPAGSSTTQRLEFRVLGEGILTPSPVRVVEIDDTGKEVEGSVVTVEGDMMPEVVVVD